MKQMLSVLSVLLLSAFAQADVGFDNGNEIVLTPTEGTAHVMCYDQMDYGWRSYYCDATFVNPSTHARLVNDGAKILADKVEITANHEDGSSKTKTKKFDASKQSSDRVNLVISTVTQRPLLDLGKNVVDYKFSKSGREIQSGSFEVSVDLAPRLRCESMSFTMTNGCSAAVACDRYYNMRPRCE